MCRSFLRSPRTRGRPAARASADGRYRPCYIPGTMAGMSARAPLENVALAPYCTLGVGGPARFFVDALDEPTLVDALGWAQARGVGMRVLGGGSNLLVADGGVDTLV